MKKGTYFSDPRVAFFERELAKLPPDRMLSLKANGEAVLRCPVHNGGMERTPSLGINLGKSKKSPLGAWNCLACHVGGGWNAFAELMGLRRLNAKDHGAQVADRYVYVPPDDDKFELPDIDALMAWPEGLPWRGIPDSTLIHYNFRLINWGGKPSAYMPVTIYNEPVGGIFIALERASKKEKAYLNTPGEWSGDAVLGFDQAMEMAGEPLWVVEGPRDMANVAAHGGRVVALIGAAVTSTKVKLISELDPPIVLRATDPDEAGDTASKALKSVLRRKYGIASIRVNMQEDSDPADLKRENVQRVIKRAYELL